MENALHIRLVSGLVKARVDDTITTFAPYENATALRGDRLFFSLLAYVPFGVHGSMRTVVNIKNRHILWVGFDWFLSMSL